MAKSKERYKKILSIDTILEDVVEKLVDRKKSPLLKIELAWNNTFDNSITNNCQPIKFRRGILTVKCSNSFWKSEMLFFKEEIKSKLIQKLGEDIIKDIYFI
ncbi:MAG: DUF721 domain-containing protein [Ignavibacteria bacterium]|nr:DUF721 domain-containing protein [Ignavibacteria bacterium]